MERLQNNPVLVMVTGFVAAAVALLVAFGVDVTAEQSAAISGFVVAVYVVAVYVRSKVTPNRKLAAAHRRRR